MNSTKLELKKLNLVAFLLFLTIFLSFLYSNATENRKKIAVIDSGLKITKKIKPYLCEGFHKSFADNNPFLDSYEHGTNVAGLISENIDPSKWCLVIIKYEGSLDDFIKALEYSIEIKASMINMSVEGPHYSQEELNLLKKAMQLKMVVSVAAGNRRGDQYNLDKACIVYPACYIYNLDPKLFHVVGSYTGNFSNYGRKTVRFWENGVNRGYPVMSGTSQATAIHTGKWTKYIDRGGN